MCNNDYVMLCYFEGNDASGPLSLLITTEHADKNIFLCEAPGMWGKILPGFASLYNASLELHITDLNSNSNSQQKDFLNMIHESKQKEKENKDESSKEEERKSQKFPSVLFDFQVDKAVQVSYSHTKVDELCIQVLHQLPVGQYVLTIVPRSKKKITLAYVLIP